MNRFKSQSKYRDSLITTNPILRSVPTKPKKPKYPPSSHYEPLTEKSLPKNKKSSPRQYGDKGYKPSNGIGVGY